MRFRLLPLTGLCLVSSAFLVVVQAQNGVAAPKKPARKVPVAPAADQTGAMILNGQNSLYDGATDTSKLTGNVSVTQVGEDFILYAQSLVYSKPQNRAVATEKLRVVTRESTIRGLRIDADFDTKVLTMTGNVVINTYGKGDGITGNRPGTARAELASKPSKLLCDRVDWDYETRQAVLIGNIRMEQGKNRGTCERIEFDERQNVAKLKGNVRFTDDKGQTYSTPDLTIYNNENRIETGRSILRILPNTAPKAAPRAPKPPIPIKKAPVISDEDLKIFGGKPAPIPAFKPEPAPTPVPEPAGEEAPDGAAPADDAPDGAAAG